MLTPGECACDGGRRARDVWVREGRPGTLLPPLAVSSSSMTTRATTAMDTDDKARQASSPRAALLRAPRGGDTVGNSRSPFCLRASRCWGLSLHAEFCSVAFVRVSLVLPGGTAFLVSFYFFSAKPATKAVVLSIFSVFGRCRSESVVSAVWYLVGVGRPLVCGTTDIVVTTAFFFPFLCDVQLTA